MVYIIASSCSVAQGSGVLIVVERGEYIYIYMQTGRRSERSRSDSHLRAFVRLYYLVVTMCK